MYDEVIWELLKGNGLPKEAVAGVMGNLYAESGLSPVNLQNSFERASGYTDETYTAAVDDGSYKNFVNDSAGYGLAQWTFWSRKEKLLSYARFRGKSVGDLRTQLDFLWSELKGMGLIEELKNVKSVREASDIILTKFEKPADQSEAVKVRRAEWGERYLKKFAPKPPGVATELPFQAYTVKVTADALNIRKGAGTDYAVVGCIRDMGVYTITDEMNGAGAKAWGKLKSGAGWIALDFTERV
jgi:hypothetical protein